MGCASPILVFFLVVFLLHFQDEELIQHWVEENQWDQLLRCIFIIIMVVVVVVVVGSGGTTTTTTTMTTW